ncbi:unnamed protein product [Penicillium salamii]|uniref:DUF2293 domain-containing protein n=1 Tax=Penicillium salamii TaxID=1612424 RepID=A0A9W4NBP1_9EURO|nr:unnamed protein product [Penicillium salamii]CAG8334191.1 unnamed protein product [Penicillium salamii]CAG8358906.1 unnamed protein product [Penicillium salamii]CAG8369489.1 unnamed protein product [Penicillium salamii]
MARVMGRAASATARRTPSRAVQRRARRHKVIMESVTQEKKKLRSVVCIPCFEMSSSILINQICFEAQAPSGYTFIPAGNPQLTTACKERCRKEGLQIHAVSTTPHHKTHNLSQHVHRIGYHFPSTVVAAVCSELGLYLTSTGKTMPIYAMGRVDNNSRAASEVSQVTLNTDARDAMRDLFPNIPDQDLNQIIKTAFQKGQKKVGTATELPLARRAQLAVVAHIRHVYTNYDRLLKTTSFHEARTTVEHPTLAKVIEWRGDDENGQTVLEDVFREVIVISDDEDSETEEDAASTAAHQNTRVEILPNDARTHEIRTQPINTRPEQGYLRDISEEAPPGFRFVTRVPANNSVDRRGFSRYQAWNRAIKEYREGNQGTEQSRLAGSLAEKQSPRYAEKRIAPEASAKASDRGLCENYRRVMPVSMDNHPQHMPAIMDRYVAQRHVGVQDVHSEAQKSSSHKYNSRKSGLTSQKSPELQILEELSGPRNMNVAHPILPPLRTDPRTERLPPQSENRSNAPVFVGGPKEKPHNGVAPLGRRPGTVNATLAGQGPNTQESVMPSIENPWPQETRRTDHAHPLVHMANKMSLRSVTPGQSQGELKLHPDVIELDASGDQPSKRRRNGRECSRVDPRPEPRTARPMFPVPEGFGPRETYRRAEPALEYRPQDQLQFRRDIVPVEPPLSVGHLHPHSASYASGLDTRSVMDRQHVDWPREPRPLNGVSGSGWHPYHGRNLRLDRPKEQRGMRRARMDSRIVPENPPDRNLYADGFVRHVDHREPPSHEYASRRLIPEAQPQPKPVGDALLSRNREWELNYLATKNMSQFQDEQLSRTMGRVARPEHHRTFSDSAPKSQPHTPPPQVPRERPLSGGFISRPLYNPPQEQNRPVYVQAVEPRTERQPFQPILDGRHFVVVD